MVHERKAQKSRLSKALRLGSIILAVIGGAIALASPLLGGLRNASAAYLFFAVAAGLQLIDRYFGYSSSWSRFVATAMQLNATFLALQIDYSRLRHAGVMDDSIWQLIKDYATFFTSCIGHETTEWTVDFQEALRAAELPASK
ncbi:MAG: SLATT domain-containing protein [Micropruina sp.]|nr:SLATT domain-containing protein [Micropruina sp.]